MKSNYFFIALTVTFLPLLLQAQINVGIQGGIHTNYVSVKGISESWMPEQALLTGINLGVYAELPLQNGFSFQPGLTYIEKGFRVKEGYEFNIVQVNVPVGIEARPRIQFLELPLLMKYTYGEGFAKVYGFVGPHISYAVDGDIELIGKAIVDVRLGRYPINLSNRTFNRFEVGGIAGAGVAFQTGHVHTFFQGSFQRGFTDMLETPILDIRAYNYGYNILAGIYYTFGG